MARRELGRVVDPSELDRGEGTRGRVRVEVPTTWLTERALVELRLPELVCCGRCDGGGCDGCGRSGALRIAGSAEQRKVRLTLPAKAGGALVRLVRPLEQGDLEQLIVELRPADRPSTNLHRISIEEPRSAPALADDRRGMLAAGAAIAALAALIAALASNW